MSKKLHKTYVLATDVETAYADLVDTTYLEEKAAALDHREFEIRTHEVSPDGGARVVSSKKVRAEVPGFAKKFLSEWNAVVQDDTWGEAAADGSRTCTFDVDIKNLPSTVKGSLVLSPKGDSTQVTVDIECKVSIPMVGGKIEGLLMADLEKTAEAEKTFGEQWLARKA